MKKFHQSRGWYLVGVACIVFIFLALSFAKSTQAEDLNVTIKGLDKVETYLVTHALESHKLPLSTPITIEKNIVKRDWNGQMREFNTVKVVAKIADKKYIGEVSERDFPQLDGREYYGLLQQAVNYACSGPESARYAASADSACVALSIAIKAEAKKGGHAVQFFARNPGSNRTTFTINKETVHEVSWFPEGRDNKSPGYFMVRNGKMEPVTVAAIFASIPKMSISKK